MTYWVKLPKVVPNDRFRRPKDRRARKSLKFSIGKKYDPNFLPYESAPTIFLRWPAKHVRWPVHKLTHAMPRILQCRYCTLGPMQDNNSIARLAYRFGGRIKLPKNNRNVSAGLPVQDCDCSEAVATFRQSMHLHMKHFVIWFTSQEFTASKKANASAVSTEQSSGSLDCWYLDALDCLNALPDKMRTQLHLVFN